jgi:hypothetical protein
MFGNYKMQRRVITKLLGRALELPSVADRERGLLLLSQDINEFQATGRAGRRCERNEAERASKEAEQVEEQLLASRVADLVEDHRKRPWMGWRKPVRSELERYGVKPGPLMADLPPLRTAEEDLGARGDAWRKSGSTTPRPWPFRWYDEPAHVSVGIGNGRLQVEVVDRPPPTLYPIYYRRDLDAAFSDPPTWKLYEFEDQE